MKYTIRFGTQTLEMAHTMKDMTLARPMGRLLFRKKNLWLRIQKAVAYTLATCVMTIICVGSVSALNLTFAKEVLLQGKPIGLVANPQQMEQLITQTEAFLQDELGQTVTNNITPTYITRLVRANHLTESHTLQQNLLSTYPYVTAAFSVYADGNRLCTMTDEAKLNTSLEQLKNQYFVAGEQATVAFVQQVEIKKEFVPVSYLVNAPAALASLQVRSSYTEHAEEAIPFDNERQMDDQLAKGTTQQVVPGTEGLKKVVAQVVAINGKITERNVLSEDIVSQPVDGIIKIGVKEAPSVGSGQLVRPVYGTITSRFGIRRSGQHTGIDYANPVGTPVYAADNGVVTSAGWNGGYGNLVVIDHGNGIETYYAHNSQLCVSVGQTVAKGDLICKVGNTGNSTGAHCHFEVRVNGKPQNPEHFVH